MGSERLFLRCLAMPPLYPRISDLSNRDGSSGNAFDVRRTPRVSCSHSHGSTLDRVLLPPALTLRSGTALGRMEGVLGTPVPARPQPSTLVPQPFSASNTGPLLCPTGDNRTPLPTSTTPRAAPRPHPLRGPRGRGAPLSGSLRPPEQGTPGGAPIAPPVARPGGSRPRHELDAGLPREEDELGPRDQANAPRSVTLRTDQVHRDHPC